jgi:hypothetical protein
MAGSSGVATQIPDADSQLDIRVRDSLIWCSVCSRFDAISRPLLLRCLHVTRMKNGASLMFNGHWAGVVRVPAVEVGISVALASALR